MIKDNPSKEDINPKANKTVIQGKVDTYNDSQPLTETSIYKLYIHSKVNKVTC